MGLPVEQVQVIKGDYSGNWQVKLKVGLALGTFVVWI